MCLGSKIKQNPNASLIYHYIQMWKEKAIIPKSNRPKKPTGVLVL